MAGSSLSRVSRRRDGARQDHACARIASWSRRRRTSTPRRESSRVRGMVRRQRHGSTLVSTGEFGGYTRFEGPDARFLSGSASTSASSLLASRRACITERRRAGGLPRFSRGDCLLLIEGEERRLQCLGFRAIVRRLDGARVRRRRRRPVRRSSRRGHATRRRRDLSRIGAGAEPRRGCRDGDARARRRRMPPTPRTCPAVGEAWPLGCERLGRGAEPLCGTASVSAAAR